MENENCWPLTGRDEGRFIWGKMRRRFEGRTAHVKFDRQYVYDLEDEKKDLPPNERPIVGFVHTHPTFPAIPSVIDHATMGAWVNCLGKPLWCVIKGVDGIRAYLYEDDESEPLEAEKCVECDGVIIISGICNNFKDKFLDEEDGVPILECEPSCEGEIPEFTPSDFEFHCPSGHGRVCSGNNFVCEVCGWAAFD